MHFYFAYGSNLDQAQMCRRCPGSKLVGAGALAKHRLDFTRYSKHWQGGVADVVPDVTQEVWGLIYHLSANDLGLLDGYESYPMGYDRTQVTVKIADHSWLESVWVYQVAKKKSFMPPHSKYLGIIQSAAEQWNFPVHYRRHLDQIEKATHG
ncbi:gamma-glutamylcyclotransferase [filamentous cyanobacterium LEGE 11480]|uniref:Gamma-glutamylcyclotransferase n=1 Tax=Romeriopsis navalis LEGE 11480 TaxID=2777977 RepID=A0A928VSA2_9CYAN|nr:gamma-glutamylcyclotransferase family protein [Romeriopsis navalis]MBE9031627.1 gamma-glutamylcyclotransferase [Romeriopsis navalis LEGE 11480]